jgi:hypothetical protein
MEPKRYSAEADKYLRQRAVWKASTNDVKQHISAYKRAIEQAAHMAVVLPTPNTQRP